MTLAVLTVSSVFVSVFISSHLLCCQPLFDSRQVASSLFPLQSHTCTQNAASTAGIHIYFPKHSTPALLYFLPPCKSCPVYLCCCLCKESELFVLPTCSLLPVLILLWLSSASLAVNGLFSTHCFCLCAA